MKVINLCAQPSVVCRYMAQLRDIHYQQNRALFHGNLQRIGRAMAYEISRTLPYEPLDVTTPLGVKRVLACHERVVVGTVLRAGLAFHQGFLDVFEEADAAFVAAYRQEESAPAAAHESAAQQVAAEVNNTPCAAPTIKLDYLAAPSLEGCTFILVDPMLATGGSLALAYETFLRAGTPRRLHICCAIAAPEGVARLQQLFPGDEVTLWLGDLDDHLNAAAYIVPGLGDAGDLSFGEKLSL